MTVPPQATLTRLKLSPTLSHADCSPAGRASRVTVTVCSAPDAASPALLAQTNCWPYTPRPGALGTQSAAQQASTTTAGPPSTVTETRPSGRAWCL